MSPVPTMERAPGTARHPDHETSYPNGDDLRRDPLEVRKATLASIVIKASSGIRFNEHIEGNGPTVLAHACKMGLEGIVSKRKDSRYRSGRSPDWLKMKKPGVCGGDARGGGRLELEHGPASAISPSLVPLLQ